MDLIVQATLKKSVSKGGHGRQQKPAALPEAMLREIGGCDSAGLRLEVRYEDLVVSSARGLLGSVVKLHVLEVEALEE